MDKISREKWLRDCEKCSGDVKRVMKIIRGGYFYYNCPKKLITRMKLLYYKAMNNYYNRLLHGIEIPLQTNIGSGIRMVHLNGIVINQYAVIGENCTIFQQVTVGAVCGGWCSYYWK